jgi:hypothetical protein
MDKLLEERENGTYYLGDLSAARAYLLDWYGGAIRETRRQDGGYLVGEYLEGDDEPSQWGMSAAGDPDEAWRYFAGTDFGPVDSEYDEAGLREALAGHREAV